jgi:hypothetical protein
MWQIAARQFVAGNSSASPSASILPRTMPARLRTGIASPVPPTAAQPAIAVEHRWSAGCLPAIAKTHLEQCQQA